MKKYEVVEVLVEEDISESVKERCGILLIDGEPMEGNWKEIEGVVDPASIERADVSQLGRMNAKRFFLTLNMGGALVGCTNATNEDGSVNFDELFFALTTEEVYLRVGDQVLRTSSKLVCDLVRFIDQAHADLHLKKLGVSVDEDGHPDLLQLIAGIKQMLSEPDARA